MNQPPFELQPTLTGSLIDLRPLRPDDFEALYAQAADPLVWELHPQRDRYQRDVFEKFFSGAMESGGAFAAVEKATGTIAGSSRFYDVAANPRSVIIGYTFLGRKYWGGEYNREMKRLMLKHAFRFVDTVRFQIGESNLRSRRAIEKIGASFVEKQVLDEKAHVIYALSVTDFVNGGQLGSSVLTPGEKTL